MALIQLADDHGYGQNHVQRTGAGNDDTKRETRGDGFDPGFGSGYGGYNGSGAGIRNPKLFLLCVDRQNLRDIIINTLTRMETP